MMVELSVLLLTEMTVGSTYADEEVRTLMKWPVKVPQYVTRAAHYGEIKLCPARSSGEKSTRYQYEMASKCETEKGDARRMARHGSANE